MAATLAATRGVSRGVAGADEDAGSLSDTGSSRKRSKAVPSAEAGRVRRGARNARPASHGFESVTVSSLPYGSSTAISLGTSGAE